MTYYKLQGNIGDGGGRQPQEASGLDLLGKRKIGFTAHKTDSLRALQAITIDTFSSSQFIKQKYFIALEISNGFDSRQRFYILTKTLYQLDLFSLSLHS